jgi:hypothetical protein
LGKEFVIMASTPKWEYKVVPLKESNKYEVRTSTEGSSSEIELKDISELGHDGWELVSIVRLDPVYTATGQSGADSSNPYAYFKRPFKPPARLRGGKLPIILMGVFKCSF